ncbi:polysaccharide biosynthesis protein [Paenibacillus cymbidii]|uniref:polysaccharide biosynthesis protein n=1 Tax=Paenibacillus cymbidii TaxID=1639034 RepID=UPI001081E509|nr:nucleoside-diphosphate sugar epimerase/dehydratase [Paenibacillus cymbidii]
MNYRIRMYSLLMLDIAMVWVSIVSSYWFRFGSEIPTEYVQQMVIFGGVSTVVGAACLILFKLYNRIWQYASIGELISVLKVVVTFSIVTYFLTYLISGQRIPLSIVIRNFETLVLLIGGTRFAWRVLRDKYLNRKTNQLKALIIGAGDCGTLILKELKFNSASRTMPVAFIDDDIKKHRMQVHGITVVGGRHRIIEIVELFEIDEIIIAIPSASRKDISDIIDICKKTKATLKIIPRINDIIQGKVSINHIRNVEVEDLLGRDPVKTDLALIASYITEKRILVTGAGGSIGSELCRQIARFQPEKLLLLGHGENSIYDIEMEMRRTYPTLNIQSIIADIRDRPRIEEIFHTYQPQVVFHAAAHKHVPLMESNPAEAIKNNVFGTKNVAECADQYGAERFVLISTDKAVNPTSIMGATKRIAEMLIQCLDRTSKTKFVAVRFGNVLGSRGSVIPRFKEQIAHGGPVTVTHPDMIRYFMTIPEAVQLVIQAGSLAQGGEIFILDMGKPVRILDLAQDLIRLSGFEPGVDIKIEFTGMRPGEKLYEELLLSEEGATATTMERIFVGKPMNINRSELEFEIKRLERVLDAEQQVIQEAVKMIVPSYRDAS